MKARYFLLFALLAPPFLFAGSPEEAAGLPQDPPIESKMNLGFLGLVGGGMDYTLAGKPLRRFEDFEKLIYPLRDDQATQLLQDSKECHFAAWMCYVSGGLLTVDVALSFKPVTLLGVDWFDRAATGVAVGEALWGLGALLESAADARKYNAVQRYNQLLRKNDQAFLGLKPQLCLAPGGFLLDVGRDF